jgi:hypothetical protein
MKRRGLRIHELTLTWTAPLPTAKRRRFSSVLTIARRDKITSVTIVRHPRRRFGTCWQCGTGGTGKDSRPFTPTDAVGSNKYAAVSGSGAHQPMRLLEWVRKYHDWKQS